MSETYSCSKSEVLFSGIAGAVFFGVLAVCVNPWWWLGVACGLGGALITAVQIRRKRREGISSSVEDAAELFLHQARTTGKARVETGFSLMKELISRAREEMKGVAVPKDTILMGGPPELQIALQARVRCAQCRAVFSERYAESIWLAMEEGRMRSSGAPDEPTQNDTCPRCGSERAEFTYERSQDRQV